MQVDCAGVSLLMTGSPHTSMPYAMHHFKPRPRVGVFFMFRTNGYVQDERYTAGAGRAGAVPVRFARCLTQDAQERRVSVLHNSSLTLMCAP